MSEGTNINSQSKVRFIISNSCSTIFNLGKLTLHPRFLLTIDEVVVKYMTFYFRPITKMVLDQRRQQSNIMKVFNR